MRAAEQAAEDLVNPVDPTSGGFPDVGDYPGFSVVYDALYDALEEYRKQKTTLDAYPES